MIWVISFKKKTSSSRNPAGENFTEHQKTSIEDDILPMKFESSVARFCGTPRPVIFVGISGGYIHPGRLT